MLATSMDNTSGQILYNLYTRINVRYIHRQHQWSDTIYRHESTLATSVDNTSGQILYIYTRINVSFIHRQQQWSDTIYIHESTLATSIDNTTRHCPCQLTVNYIH